MSDLAKQTAIPVAIAADVREPSPCDRVFSKVHADLVKGKSVRGGLVALIAQGLKFGLTTGSSVILARLLTPQDFGLQGMVAAVTGFLALFTDIGLGMAIIQRDVVTHEQSSTIFWINVGAGAGLTLLTAALAPALVAFYHEPRLLWITIAWATSFFIGGLGAQHSALLRRSMRYVTLAKVELLSLAVGVGLAVVMAALGCGYWALVSMAISSPIVRIVGMWLATRWVPGMPRRGCGVASMIHFGGAVTLNNLVVYVGYNAEKFLLGRYWGADALGLYGRAYSLVNLPTTQLHSSMFTVAFPALARLQSDPRHLRDAFLKGYSILLSFTIPLTIACMVFADEMIRVLLGPKWLEAIPIFRLLVPTVLVFGLINPFGWFLTASGRVMRSLNIALLIAPSVILGIGFGLRYGPKGVALAYSLVMILLTIPVIAWVIRGTGITFAHLWRTMKHPFLSGLVAVGAGLSCKLALSSLPVVPRLMLGVGVTLGFYAGILLSTVEQRHFYADLLTQVFQRVRSREAESKAV